MTNEEYFKGRRTVRHYTTEPISDGEIERLVELAAHAPTTGNMQLYSVVVTRDEEMKRKLSPMHFNQPSVMASAAVLTFCADFNRFVKWCEASYTKPGYDNFQSFMTAVLDTTIFAQQFCTAAEMNGYGCCYLGTTTYNAPEIAELLQLPELVVPVTTLTIGRPAAHPEDCGRLDPSAVIHHEHYRDYTPQAISAIYAEKEAREDSRQFVAENGKQSLAQVFTDVRYTREANEHFSRVYRDFIEHAGFKFPK